MNGSDRMNRNDRMRGTRGEDRGTAPAPLLFQRHSSLPFIPSFLFILSVVAMWLAPTIIVSISC
jgi:hypothetical protein